MSKELLLGIVSGGAQMICEVRCDGTPVMGGVRNCVWWGIDSCQESSLLLLTKAKLIHVNSGPCIEAGKKTLIKEIEASPVFEEIWCAHTMKHLLIHFILAC